MKKTLLSGVLVFFLAVSNTVCFPRQSEEKEKTWEAYSHSVLYRLFPEEKDTISKIKIFISPDFIPNASSSISLNIIKVNVGMILVIESEDEFAAMLGHEYGHLRSKHKPFFKMTSWFVFEEDFKISKNQELEADNIAIKALLSAGYNKCAQYNLYERFAQIYNSYDNLKNPYNRREVERVAIAKSYCTE